MIQNGLRCSLLQLLNNTELLIQCCLYSQLSKEVQAHPIILLAAAVNRKLVYIINKYIIILLHVAVLNNVMNACM